MNVTFDLVFSHKVKFNAVGKFDDWNGIFFTIQVKYEINHVQKVSSEYITGREDQLSSPK